MHLYHRNTPLKQGFLSIKNDRVTDKLYQLLYLLWWSIGLQIRTIPVRIKFFWWREMDSNHRSKMQQIYSLPPLATREPLHKMELVMGLEPATC